MQKNDEGTAKREPAKAQNEMDERLISPDQKSVHGIFVFRRNFAADEQRHQHRHKRHAEERGEEHRESFCERQRTEKTAFLRVSEKTGMKLTVMTSSAKNSGRPTAFAPAMMTLNTLGVVGFAPMFFAKVLKRLMRVLDHDDRRIDHRADGDGDAA